MYTCVASCLSIYLYVSLGAMESRRKKGNEVIGIFRSPLVRGPLIISLYVLI